MAAEIVYRGQKIEFQEFNEEWECKEFGFSEKSLKKLQEKIDNQIKKDSKFTKMPAIFIGNSSWRGVNFGSSIIITSVTESEDVWISHKGNRNKFTKFDKQYFAVDNEDTKSKIQQFLQLGKQIEGLKLQQKNVLDSIEKVFKYTEETSQ